MTLTIDREPWTPAAEIIGRDGWTPGAEREADGRMCLTGGLKHCGLAPGEWLIARAVARHRGHGEQWNDAPGRTETEVLGWLRSAVPVTNTELARVFGPQWEPVCVLVMRAASLTYDEACHLDAAWDASRSTSMDTAWFAARDAASAAARDGTWALSVRDLIGDKFTQAHYHRPTGPWRTVIGPVHPDDPKGPA